MEVILFSPQCPPRLQYIANFISGQIAGCACIITNNLEEYTVAKGIKFSYSSASVADNEIWIQPHSLLFENNIRLQVVSCFLWDDLKVFFKTGGDLPFDIFAASFYLLSRYEEYLSHDLDKYGRYAHKNSLAFKEHFLRQPLINLWLKKMQLLIQKKFPGFEAATGNFQFIPTYDIDIAYAYRNRSFSNMVAGLIKSIIKPGDFLERASTLIGRKKDPFDIYDWLDELHDLYGLQPTYFFLVANKRGKYDKNISPHKNDMRHLIQRHKAKYCIGIHPSCKSNTDENILKAEIAVLSEIANIAVQHSRQHYLLMQMPYTYRTLTDHGIKHDYSMGYGSINGFRASVATSYFWYDLLYEKQTTLAIHPFCFMDSNSFFQQHFSAAKALEELQQYHNMVKSVNGEFVTIFHNHFLTPQSQWAPWREIYVDFLIKNFN